MATKDFAVFDGDSHVVEPGTKRSPGRRPDLDPDQLFDPLAMPPIDRIVILPVPPDDIEPCAGGFRPG